jgi:anti-sigma B factor antagonist
VVWYDPLVSPAGLLQVRDEEREGAHVIHVEGEGDLSNSSLFGQRLLEIADPGDRKIVLDLLGLRFMDSTMVHAILSATAPVRRKGGEMVIACNNPDVGRILQITAIDGVFRVLPTVEEALAVLLGRTS